MLRPLSQIPGSAPVSGIKTCLQGHESTRTCQRSRANSQILYREIAISQYTVFDYSQSSVFYRSSVCDAVHDIVLPILSVCPSAQCRYFLNILTFWQGHHASFRAQKPLQNSMENPIIWALNKRSEFCNFRSLSQKQYEIGLSSLSNTSRKSQTVSIDVM